MFLASDLADVLDRFDPKFYWRLSDAEQHEVLANDIVNRRARDIEQQRLEQVAAGDDDPLKAELIRLNEECRAILWDLHQRLESMLKSRRYAAHEWLRSLSCVTRIKYPEITSDELA